MAIGDSAVSICNTGLILIGSDPINAFTDNTKRAILCNLRYDQLRRDVLRRKDWNFARKRVQLPAASMPPAFGYSAAYPVPPDFLRLLPPDDDDDLYGEDFCIEQNNGATSVLTNYSDDNGVLNLRYVYDCSDASLMDPLFVSALGARIGLELATPLSRSAAEKQLAQKAYDDALSDASTASSQENAPQEMDSDILLVARG